MFPIRIRCVNWIVCTIRKQVKVRKIIICIDESTPGGVVISTPEIIQPGFSVVDIATVAEGVIGAYAACGEVSGSKNAAPSIINVHHNQLFVAIQQPNNITLLIEDVIVSVASVRNGHRTTRRIIGETINGATLFHAKKQAAVVVPVAICCGTIAPLGTY
jgi:hypothetical protein